MTQTRYVLTLSLLSLLFSYNTVFAHPSKIGSINLYLKVSNTDVSKNTDLELRLEALQKNSELEKSTLEKKLHEQQLNEANFQLFSILFMSIIIVGFVITFYFLKTKRLIAEREAQESRVEALKERLRNLQIKYGKDEKLIDFSLINQNLRLPLIESDIETLQMCLEGTPNSEIAEKLLLSTDKVKLQLRTIYQKLEDKNQKEGFNYTIKSSS